MIRAGKSTWNYFRFGKTRVCIRQSKNGFFEGRTTASSRIAVLFIDCEIVHARPIYLSVLGFAEDLEARVLKSSPQTKAPRATHRVRSRVPHKTGDGACGNSGGGTVRVERLDSDGKPETFLLVRARRSSKFSSFNSTLCNNVPG